MTIMNSRTNLYRAFVIAVFLHVCAGYCAAWMLCSAESVVRPVFKQGETGVMLDLVAVTPILEPVEQAPVVSETPPEPEPEQRADAVVEPEKKTGSRVEENESMAADDSVRGVENISGLKAVVHPYYPRDARKRGEEGLVKVRVSVDRHGRADSVEVVASSGYPSLDRAAMDALRKAEFVGADGTVASSDKVVLSVRFRLID